MRRRRSGALLAAAVLMQCLAHESQALQSPGPRVSRRRLLEACFAGGLVAMPAVASAGEVGAKITKAVTTSDLGISVRRSVVQGAQTMDALDGQWERFSDKYGLGEARKKQDKLPPPKVIPDPLPLDSAIASKLLELSDSAFISATDLDPATLARQVERVADTVQAAFGGDKVRTPTTGGQFNFLSYAHFKAYSDIIIERKLPFRAFKKDFEDALGAQVVRLLLPGMPVALDSRSSTPATLKYQLQETVSRIGSLRAALVQMGLVSLVEVSKIESDSLTEWSEDLADLEWNVTIDGDVTLQAQILLQEQGFRLYPNFARYGVQALLNGIGGQNIDVMDYYVDTNYNSDPDKFDPKEVLLSIVLESK